MLHQSKLEDDHANPKTEIALVVDYWNHHRFSGHRIRWPPPRLSLSPDQQPSRRLGLRVLQSSPLAWFTPASRWAAARFKVAAHSPIPVAKFSAVFPLAFRRARRMFGACLSAVCAAFVEAEKKKSTMSPNLLPPLPDNVVR
jgi:hypothetical protein